MNCMSELKYLVHFYTNKEYLFQTVTMYGGGQQDSVLKELADGKCWYYGRYQSSERSAYMRRRIAVEHMLYNEFVTEHGPLKCKTPVYLYAFPGLSDAYVDRNIAERRSLGEADTKYLLFDIEELMHESDISFTVDDSMRSYRRKLNALGIQRREQGDDLRDLDDLGRIFPLEALPEIFRRNCQVPDIRFEIQIWDRNILINYLDRHGINID